MSDKNKNKLEPESNACNQTNETKNNKDEQTNSGWMEAPKRFSKMDLLLFRYFQRI